MDTKQVEKALATLKDTGEALTRIADALKEEGENMTEIRKVEGQGTTLYYIGEEPFVRLHDVLDLIGEEKEKFRQGTEVGYIDDDEHGRIASFLALNSLQTKLIKSELKKAESPDDIRKTILAHHKKHRKPTVIPSRYAVGKKYDEENDYWMFFVDSKDGKPVFTNRPCMAKLYQSYKSAEACADFMDEDGWEVCDMWGMLSSEQRLLRAIMGETDWDDGNENAVRLNFG